MEAPVIIGRIVAPSAEEPGEETGILSRMRKTELESGPIPADEAEFQLDCELIAE